MILQALVSHYETLVCQGKLEAPGRSPVPVSYALRLNTQGELLQLMSLKTPVLKGKKEVLSPRAFNLPTPPKKGTGITPGFLSGNGTYLLGLDSKGDLPWSLARYEAARDLHLGLLDGVDTPSACAIRLFFETWQPENAATHPALSETLEELAAGIVLIFMVDTDFAHEDPEILSAWQRHYDSSDPDAVEMPCLVTGKIAPTARLHPLIKGVRNAQAMGTNLISFNAPAFLSYNRDQGYNSPVGEYAAFAYGAALNHLLADRAHTQLVGDTTVVFWSEAGDTESQDVFGGILNGVSDETLLEDKDLTRIFRAVSKGNPVDWSVLTLKAETPFYVLGLVPNAARLSVRFFLRDSFGAMVEHLREHYERLRIVKPANDKREALPLFWLLNETVNLNSRDKAPSPQMAGDVLRAILTGSDYPATLYNAVQLRIRADREITRGRAAIIKAYLLKKYKEKYKEVATVELNDQTTYQPYVLGRLFSVLEAIQQSANPGINATIKDKFFSAACATPIVAFPHLIDLANKHLRKLGTGSRIYFEKQLGELTQMITASYPNHHSLEDQGIFQLGYYHQTQKRYEPKQKEEDK